MLRIDPSGRLDTFVRNLERAPAVAAEEYRRAAEESVAIAVEEVRRRTPVATGYTQAQITGRVEGSGLNLTGIIEAPGVPHLAALEEGSRPHLIRARGRALRFVAGGVVLFRKEVQHPGTTGRHMFRDGAQAASRRVFFRFVAASARVTRRVGRGG